MIKYSLHGVDCFNLIDLTREPISFKDNPRDHIPRYGSIVYIIWNKSKNCLGLFETVGIKRRKKKKYNNILDILGKKKN